MAGKDSTYAPSTCLADGGVLVTSGSFATEGGIVNNAQPQVWRDGAWHDTTVYAVVRSDLPPAGEL